MGPWIQGLQRISTRESIADERTLLSLGVVSSGSPACNFFSKIIICDLLRKARSLRVELACFLRAIDSLCTPLFKTLVNPQHGRGKNPGAGITEMVVTASRSKPKYSLTTCKGNLQPTMNELTQMLSVCSDMKTLFACAIILCFPFTVAAEMDTQL